MGSSIAGNPITGLSVYGIQQMSYTVETDKGTRINQDYAAAVAMATLHQATTFEAEATAVSAMVRVRMDKLEELGRAMSILSEALASLPKDNGSDIKTPSMPALREAQNIINKYNVGENGPYDLAIDDENRIDREHVSKGQNFVQYAIDKEDNDLQQDSLALDSLISKRGTSFSTATKLMSKITKAASTIIANIGS